MQEPFFVTCLLANGEPPSKYIDGVWQGVTSFPGATYTQYRDRVQDWWINSIATTPPPKQAAGIRFFRRFMRWYHAQKKES